MDEVELSLLSEVERHEAEDGLTVEEEQEYLGQPGAKGPVSSRDKRAIILLIILCELIPVYVCIDSDLSSPGRPDTRFSSKSSSRIVSCLG